jgi:hypothetical protein
MIKKLVILIIRGYQILLSPIFGRFCRFEPTCSNYMLEAIEKKGLCRGIMMGSWRIVRCNPFCKGGYDPVDKEDNG